MDGYLTTTLPNGWIVCSNTPLQPSTRYMEDATIRGNSDILLLITTNDLPGDLESYLRSVTYKNWHIDQYLSFLLANILLRKMSVLYPPGRRFYSVAACHREGAYRSGLLQPGLLARLLRAPPHVPRHEHHARGKTYQRVSKPRGGPRAADHRNT